MPKYTVSRKKTSFSFSIFFTLMVAVVSITFGTINLRASDGHNKKHFAVQLTINELLSNLTEAKRFNFFDKDRIRKLDFSIKNTPSLPLSALLQPLAEGFLAGNLDFGFGNGGKLTTQFSDSTAEALAVVTQPDGKFVLAGRSSSSSGIDFSLARYNANGTLDATFGSGGKVTTDIGNADNEILALAIQPADGKLIAAGNSFNGTNDDFALVRYKTDGSLDETFGTAGIVTTDFNNSFDSIESIAVQTDSKFVVAGYSFDDSFFHFALARYNSNGSLDQSFGTGGKLTTNFTDYDDLARAVALQTDGKIIVAGEADGAFAVARYNNDGSLDKTFGTDGRVTTSINIFGVANDLLIQPDGKIIVGGETNNNSNSDFALIRYQSNGTLDTTFDSDGIVTTVIGNGNEFAASLAAQSDGKIIAGGFSFNGTDDDFVLVRYNTNGSLDSSFGSAGKVSTNFGNGSFDDILGLTVQSDYRIIAIGRAGSNFAATAYHLQSITCTYTLSSTSANASADGETASFNIITEAGCPWTAISSDNWITINANSSNSGSQSVVYSIAANTGSARTGTITIAGQIFTVNQAAASSYTVSGTVTYGVTAANQTPAIVSGVNLTTTGSSVLATISDVTGSYQLSGLTDGGNYTVTPSKTEEIKGINSLDATRIQQHRVGLTTLTPNQLIAADTDGSGTVNSLDATRIQQRAVGIIAQNIIGQWKFVPGSKQYNSVNSDLTGENYQAVLVGEVSGNWSAGTGFGANFESSETKEELLPKTHERSDAAGRFEDELSEQIAQRMNQSAELKVDQSQSESAMMGASIAVTLPFNASATNGSSITIPVTIGSVHAESPIESFDFTVFYDPAVLQPASPAGSNTGTLSANCSVLSNSPQSDRVVISGACATAITTASGGVLYNLNFNVIGGSGQQTGLLFNNPAIGTQTFQFNSGNPAANTTNGSFSVLPGPTAANISVSGRVTTASGRGIRNVMIKMTDSSGNEKTAQTTAFGYYRFDNVTAGETVSLSAKARRFRFSQSTIVRTTSDSIKDADFISEH